MSVTSQTPYKKYTAAPGATLFSTAFRVLLATDLQVKVDSVLVATGFTLSGLGNPSIDVTFTTPMVGGEVVELQRKVPLARLTDYQQLGDFLAPVVNADMDRLWMALQDSGFLNALAVLLPVGDTASPMTLPSVAQRAGNFLAFDPSGNAVAVAGETGLPTNAFLATFLLAATAAAARSAIGAAAAGAIGSSGITGAALAGTLAASGITGAASSGDNTDITSALLSIVGTSRNLKASLTANGTNITFTADQVIVGTTLGSSAKRLANFSQTLNISTTGIGGMDTALGAVAGFVAVYAGAKADGTPGIWGANVTASTGTIYSGANTPTGYTYSGLVAIIPNNATPQLLAGLVLDRKYFYQLPKVIFTAATVGTSLTSQSISVAAPAAARSVDLIMINSGGGTDSFAVAADATGTGLQNFHLAADASSRASVAGMVSGYITSTFKDVPLVTAQTIFIADLGSGSAVNLYVPAYAF